MGESSFFSRPALLEIDVDGLGLFLEVNGMGFESRGFHVEQEDDPTGCGQGDWQEKRSLGSVVQFVVRIPTNNCFCILQELSCIYR